MTLVTGMVEEIFLAFTGLYLLHAEVAIFIPDICSHFLYTLAGILKRLLTLKLVSD